MHIFEQYNHLKYLGLKVFEKGLSEQQILNRRNKTLAERDIFFNLFLEKNLLIINFNKQLRDKNKRYKDYTREKDVLMLFDKNGNELKPIQLDDETIKLKKQIEKEFK